MLALIVEETVYKAIKTVNIEHGIFKGSQFFLN